MKISEILLENFSKLWTSPPVVSIEDKNKEFNISDHNLNYALNKQYLLKFKNGFPHDIIGKKIVEIGCGQGGISTFLAVNGAKLVIGTDINTDHLEIAKQFKSKMENDLEINLKNRLEFKVEDAYQMTFSDNSFDIIIADNVFEHFMQPEKVLSECYRILKPGGIVIIPNFNTYYSKYGAHLKYGLKMPWVNLIFSEKTICNTLYAMSKKDPNLLVAYPGISSNTKKIRDLRAYKDLNGMTFSRFKNIAQSNGFTLKSFVISPPCRKFKFIYSSVYRLSFLKYSKLSDVLSIGASCVLLKNK